MLVATDKGTHRVSSTEQWRPAPIPRQRLTTVEEVRRLYERYQAAESDAERREIALEMGKLDGRRHAEIYAALEDE